MNTNQTALLKALAKKLEKKKYSKDIAIKSLNLAGIVTKDGKITKFFPNLERITSITE